MNVDTNIRKGKVRFYGDAIFTHGLSRSSYFNRRESLELEEYGHTLFGLVNGSIIPENEDEQRFVSEMKLDHDISYYPVKLWKKYLAAVDKSKVHHGFSKSSAKNTTMEDLSSEVA